jgi:hypothetical protein
VIIDVDMIFIVFYCKVCVIVRRFFGDVCVRAPGGTHDAAHLRQSSFYKKLMRKEILQEHVLTIGGQQILPYVVGDYAYPP